MRFNLKRPLYFIVSDNLANEAHVMQLVHRRALKRSIQPFIFINLAVEVNLRELSVLACSQS